jgi:hypothetical protein
MTFHYDRIGLIKSAPGGVHAAAVVAGELAADVDRVLQLVVRDRAH